MAEAVNLNEKLVDNPKRPLPDNFHARTGHALIAEQSRVFQQLQLTKQCARNNKMKMKMNHKKRTN